MSERSEGMNREDPLWYKDAVIYQLHVRSFYDSNNDGIGDFRGLTQKLDYVRELGVTAIWLLPFYPSPLKDDGYDIADYHNIHAAYGNRSDFRTFLREAHRRGLRVITELVINHTSDQHPWFQAARKAPPGSSKRDFYVWSDTDQKWPETRIIFTDTETSNWAWDPVAKAYYWHRFFSHQPDLNFGNPHVVQAVLRVMRFWFDMGVDAVRLDAIPYLCERDGTNNENLPETHAVIRQLRADLDRRYPDRMFLAEANQWPEDVAEYFGQGDECHMAYHFPLMPRMFMALAQEDRHPIVEILLQTPAIPENCQWAIFLRNHDELTLEMVTDRERDYMYSAYAADPRMRVNVGIRRRLAPLMGNDPDKIKLMTGLLLSMPGSPIIYYGDELGMGENIYLGDRNGVRTPMQWSPDRNAGFSRADPQQLFLPVLMDPTYGFQAVNVEAQTRNPASLLNWMKRMIGVRKQSRVFGRGGMRLIRPHNRKILAYVRDYEEDIVLCVANVSRYAQPVELDLSPYEGRIPVELNGQTAFPPIGRLPYLLTLPPYAFYWFRLCTTAVAPAWHEERLLRPELPVVVLRDGLGAAAAAGRGDAEKLNAARVQDQIQRNVLPGYLPLQRWFAQKGDAVSYRISGAFPCPPQPNAWLMLLVEASGHDAGCYQLPLGLRWEGVSSEDEMNALAGYTLARIRMRARVGILVDAYGDAAFCNELIEGMKAHVRWSALAGEIACHGTPALAELQETGPYAVRSVGAEQSNTALLIGESLFLKAYRRLHAGPNPEVEMGTYLTEAAFPGVVPLLGAVEYRGTSGAVHTLAILQKRVQHQGDAWTYTLDYLKRCIDAAAETTSSELLDCADPQGHEVYRLLMATLGRRTAELHRVLAAAQHDPAFEAQTVPPSGMELWRDRVMEDAGATLARLRESLPALHGMTAAAARQLLEREGELRAALRGIPLGEAPVVACRYHGDYHLGQVLIVRNDFIITDFEGEPGRPFSERRARHSPLRDVAGMLRSLDYAAAAGARQVADLGSVAREPAPVLQAWHAAARQAFLQAYRDHAGAHLCIAFEALVSLFEIEKALYELRYELAMRPDWVAIPVEGITRWIDRHAAGDAAHALQ